MPIGAGARSGLNCQASPPSPSGTTRGTLWWNFFGMYSVHRCGGSRMWESAEMRLYSRIDRLCDLVLRQAQDERKNFGRLPLMRSLSKHEETAGRLVSSTHRA